MQDGQDMRQISLAGSKRLALSLGRTVSGEVKEAHQRARRFPEETCGFTVANGATAGFYQADPLCRVTGPRMNPSVDVGCPPRPFRHLRMAERCTPDPSSSRAPVHSALVQKSVTRHHQPGRSALTLDARGKSPSKARGKGKKVGTPLASRFMGGQPPPGF